MRALSDDQANALLPGSDHYRAYIGPPAQYDLMGATQFMLMVTLGLRECHRLLDFGCGSLRAGRLFIPYLATDCYFGIEPHQWLIESGLERQLGLEILKTKRPCFSNNDDFQADTFGTVFDYILCQSIFSHAGPDLMIRALHSFNRVLAAEGLVALTVLHPDRTDGREDLSNGWNYPGCISYEPARLQSIFAETGFVGRLLPWFHPRQSWYVLAKREDILPSRQVDAYLRGAILNEPDWTGSLKPAP